MPQKISAILFLLLAFTLRVNAQEASGFAEITLENIRQIGLIASTEIASINDLAWSPDGTRVAVASDDGFWIYDWRTNSRDQFEVARKVSRVAFIPNTSHLAVSFGDETSIYDAADRFQRIATFLHGFQAISPDGSIYAASDSENITLYSLKDGSIVRQIQVKVFDNCLGGCSIFDMAFSPDGQHLAFSSPVEDAESGIINLTTSEKRSSVQLGLGGLSFSSDSALVASWAGEQGYLANHILLTASETGELRASIQLYGTYAPPAFSRDGNLLIA